MTDEIFTVPFRSVDYCQHLLDSGGSSYLFDVWANSNDTFFVAAEDIEDLGNGTYLAEFSMPNAGVYSVYGRTLQGHSFQGGPVGLEIVTPSTGMFGSTCVLVYNQTDYSNIIAI